MLPFTSTIDRPSLPSSLSAYACVPDATGHLHRHKVWEVRKWKNSPFSGLTNGWVAGSVIRKPVQWKKNKMKERQQKNSGQWCTMAKGRLAVDKANSAVDSKDEQAKAWNKKQLESLIRKWWSFKADKFLSGTCHLHSLWVSLSHTWRPLPVISEGCRTMQISAMQAPMNTRACEPIILTSCRRGSQSKSCLHLYTNKGYRKEGSKRRNELC